MAEHGAGAVTHRAVAAQASVPLASVTYHFASIDEVVASTLDYANRELASELSREDWGTGIAGLARFITAQTTSHRALLIASYELYMTALRTPDLLPHAMDWLDAIIDRFTPGPTTRRRRDLRVIIEGICLHCALQPGIYTSTEIERLLKLS